MSVYGFDENKDKVEVASIDCFQQNRVVAGETAMIWGYSTPTGSIAAGAYTDFTLNVDNNNYIDFSASNDSKIFYDFTIEYIGTDSNKGKLLIVPKGFTAKSGDPSHFGGLNYRIYNLGSAAASGFTVRHFVCGPRKHE